MQSGQEEKEFFFIHVADPQLFWGTEENWDLSIEWANRLRPAFVAVAGDMVNRWGVREKNDPDSDEKMAQAYLKGARKLDGDIPLYHMAGNHDVCDRPTPETLAWYEERFGKVWYAFTHGNCFFVVLESNVFKDPGGAPDAAERQMEWLKKTLRESDSTGYAHKIVFLHHPMCLKDIDEDDGYFTLDGPVRKDLLALFHRHGVQAVFSGHYHRNVHVRDGGLELVTTSSCGSSLGDDPVGFRIVKVYPDRIEHAYYGFDEMPAAVE